MRTSNTYRLDEVAIDLRTMAQYLDAGGQPTEFFAVRMMAISEELERLAVRWRADLAEATGTGGR